MPRLNFTRFRSNSSASSNVALAVHGSNLHDETAYSFSPREVPGMCAVYISPVQKREPSERRLWRHLKWGPTVWFSRCRCVANPKCVTLWPTLLLHSLHILSGACAWLLVAHTPTKHFVGICENFIDCSTRFNTWRLHDACLLPHLLISGIVCSPRSSPRSLARCKSRRCPIQSNRAGCV